MNRREQWRGHLWQGRFASFAMDERHTLAAARYIELNPVRAGLVARAVEYPWSSARAHLIGRDDALAKVAPLCQRVGNWETFLREGGEPEVFDHIRKHSCNGRPLGSDAFVDSLEDALGRVLRARKPGPAPAAGRTAPAEVGTELRRVSPN